MGDKKDVFIATTDHRAAANAAVKCTESKRGYYHPNFVT
jgi:hypothetical protein